MADALIRFRTRLELYLFLAACKSQQMEGRLSIRIIMPCASLSCTANASLLLEQLATCRKDALDYSSSEKSGGLQQGPLQAPMASFDSSFERTASPTQSQKRKEW